jgi:hypothetical protein
MQCDAVSVFVQNITSEVESKVKVSQLTVICTKRPKDKILNLTRISQLYSFRDMGNRSAALTLDEDEDDDNAFPMSSTRQSGVVSVHHRVVVDDGHRIANRIRRRGTTYGVV